MKSALKTFLFLSIVSILSCSKEKEEPIVVLVSIDGFGHDYAEKYEAKTLLAIANEGIQASSLTPCYPSKTFPNHYSIATGMYPENHGIVDSYFYDPGIDDYYISSQGRKVRDEKWYGGNPLWVLAGQQGLKTATYFWIGSEAEINGDRPTYYKNYDPKITGDEIVTQVIEWLELPKEVRPQFVSAYFSLVDNAGHDYGVDSPELKDAVLQMDKYIGRLQNKITQLDISVNLIIVSDHGMINVDLENPIYYEEIANLENINYIPRDSHLMIYDTDSTVISMMYDAFLSKEKGRYITYKKKNIPSAYHFQNNDRIGDLLLVANPPYIFSREGKTNGKGSHGYDPSHKDMHGIFYAVGPNIKAKLKIDPFENIHIYPMIANLLDLDYDSTSIDGRHTVLENMILE